LEGHRFGARLHNTSAIITASEIIKDLVTGCCSPSPPRASFTTQLSGASDSEGCLATIIVQRLDRLIGLDPIVGQYGISDFIDRVFG
jgi:hypothetical protein